MCAFCMHASVLACVRRFYMLLNACMVSCMCDYMRKVLLVSTYMHMYVCIDDITYSIIIIIIRRIVRILLCLMLLAVLL